MAFIKPSNPDYIDLVNVDFPEDQYYKEACEKSQFVVHYKAGNDSAEGTFIGWKADKSRIATAYSVGDNGILYKGFDSKYWAAHIGYWIRDNKGNVIGGNNKAYKLCPGTDNYEYNKAIEKRTIGIEIANWGVLKLINGKYHTWASKSVDSRFPKDITIPEEKVVYYKDGFRGGLFFEKITEKELETCWKLIRLKCKEHGITCKFDGTFDLSENAIKGVSGVYSHVNFRADKQDLHPQKEVIEMFKSL